MAVDFDGLDFESNGQKVRVAIGRNFLGTTFVAASASGPSSNGGGSGGATTGPAGASGGDAAPAAGGDGNMSAIERMMRDRRRNQGAQ